jgi:hypothetical protein
MTQSRARKPIPTALVTVRKKKQNAYFSTIKHPKQIYKLLHHHKAEKSSLPIPKVEFATKELISLTKHHDSCASAKKQYPWHTLNSFGFPI